jgi:hypothetical protein
VLCTPSQFRGLNFTRQSSLTTSQGLCLGMLKQSLQHLTAAFGANFAHSVTLLLVLAAQGAARKQGHCV